MFIARANLNNVKAPKGGFSVAQTFLSAVSQGSPACESLETGKARNQFERLADRNVGDTVPHERENVCATFARAGALNTCSEGA